MIDANSADPVSAVASKRDNITVSYWARSCCSVEVTTAPQPTWTQKSPANSPPASNGHAMAYDAARGQVVLFGSDGSPNFPTTRSSGMGRIGRRRVRPIDRRALDYPAMAYDAARGQVVPVAVMPFGAPSMSWVWDGANRTLKSPANRPPELQGMRWPTTRPAGRWSCSEAARRHAGSAPAPSTTRGSGMGRTGHRRTLRTARQGVQITRWPTTRPAGRWSYSAATPQHQRHVGLGWSKLDTEEPSQPPPASHDQSMAYDAARGQVVPSTLQLAWVWDGANWTLKNPANGNFRRDLVAKWLRRGSRAGGPFWWCL